MTRDYDKLLVSAGIRPTPNRILVLRTLGAESRPMSLADIEVRLDTLDKSSISRVLNLLLSHDIVHGMEDGRGVVQYELCQHPENHEPGDMHIHFYCEKCRRTFCFEDTPVPEVAIPKAYTVRSVNYMLKGICPKCGKGQMC